MFSYLEDLTDDQIRCVREDIKVLVEAAYKEGLLEMEIQLGQGNTPIFAESEGDYLYTWSKIKGAADVWELSDE